MRKVSPTFIFPALLSVISLFILFYIHGLLSELSIVQKVIEGGFLVLGGMSIFAILKDRVWLRIAISTALMWSMVTFFVFRLMGEEPFGLDIYRDSRYLIFLIILVGSTAIGLLRKSFISRWIAMALAFSGFLSAGINVGPWLTYSSNFTWGLLLHVGGALLLFANLWGPRMRDALLGDTHEIWISKDPALTFLRFSLFSVIAAIPLLLVYSWVQNILPSTQPWALSIAAFLITGVVLVVRQKLVGAIALAVGGLALILLSTTLLYHGFTTDIPNHERIALYYSVFWIPAGFLSVLSGLKVIKPVLKLLRAD